MLLLCVTESVILAAEIATGRLILDENIHLPLSSLIVLLRYYREPSYYCVTDSNAGTSTVSVNVTDSGIVKRLGPPCSVVKLARPSLPLG